MEYFLLGKYLYLYEITCCIILIYYDLNLILIYYDLNLMLIYYLCLLNYTNFLMINNNIRLHVPSLNLLKT